MTQHDQFYIKFKQQPQYFLMRTADSQLGSLSLTLREEVSGVLQMARAARSMTGL